MKDAMQNLRKTSGDFGARWGKTVIKYRWPVLIMSIIVAMVAGYGAQYVRFNSDYHVFFSADNPQLLAYDGLQAKYTKDDNVFMVISPKEGPLFTPENLDAIETLTSQSWQVPYSSRVDAITNFQYTRAEGDDLYVDDLISNAINKSGNELAELKEIATTDTRLVNRLINEEGTVTAVNVTVRLPDADNGENAEIVAYVR